jgi:Protein of unknown function (DUF4058)
MPLRDHFHPPLSQRHSWDELHGGWPMKIVEQLSPHLPGTYLAVPQVHLGGAVEIDVGTFEYDSHFDDSTPTPEGGIATLPWKATQPQVDVEVELPEPDEYAVRVYDVTRERRLVASIEIVSPANKDRPESRLAFVTKCAALLREEVSVIIVDLVTSRESNLFSELMRHVGRSDLETVRQPSPIYVAACRAFPGKRQFHRLQAWHEALTVGVVLPTLPLWLAADFVVPLELEASYESCCRWLRM